MERKLATIRKVIIKDHPNADSLELALVDGWQVVVRKGEFTTGELVVMLEIDSWVPTNVAPFLSKGEKNPKVFEGVEGNRLRSIKLRGELSQGLVLPMKGFDAFYEGAEELFKEGDDVTSFLNIKKWERPLNPQLAGQARGYFPSFIRKTDQERIQNLFHKLDKVRGDLFEITLKLDGSSMTVYHKDGEVGVCSRNLELKLDESNEGNAFVKKVKELGLEQKLKGLGMNIAIQGELYGAGINGNWEGISDNRFAVFDVFDIDKQEYLAAHMRQGIVQALQLDSVPVLAYNTLFPFATVQDFLTYADRPSLHNSVAEGVVFKSINNPDFSFKAINNNYLLGGGE